MHCASPDERTTGRSGQDRVRASRSASQAKEPAQTIQGICGPTSIASSPPSGHLSSWESKLRDRLAMVGSTECALIWREKTTPAGGSISRLARWTPRISDSGSTGSLQTWPTPDTCAGGTGPSQANRNSPRLQDLVPQLHPWTTPQARDWKDSATLEVLQKVASGKRASSSVARDVALATWPTPCASDDRDRGRWENPAIQRRVEMGKQVMLSMLAQGPMVEASGQTTSGSPEPTANRGALNPAFPCWLMGYPEEWDACAPTVTPSSRKSRRKS